jgi:hypothetical protein
LKRDLVHVDAADQIAMAGKSTSIQDPVTACRFVLMAAFQTVGTRSDPLKLKMPANVLL